MIYTVAHIISWVLLNFKGATSEPLKQNKVNKLVDTCWPMLNCSQLNVVAVPRHLADELSHDDPIRGEHHSMTSGEGGLEFLNSTNLFTDSSVQWNVLDLITAIFQHLSSSGYCLKSFELQYENIMDLLKLTIETD